MRNKENIYDENIRVYSVERKIIEHGGENEFKDKLKNYYDHYQVNIMQILTSVALIKHARDDADKMQLLFEKSPCFMNLVFENVWFSAIIKLCSLYVDRDTKFDNFLNFIQHNRNELFTSDYYFAEVPEGIEVTDEEKAWAKRERENLDDIITGLKNKIDAQKDEINKIKIVRDKLYAHFDKKMLKKEERENAIKDIDVEMLENLAKLAEEIFNGIYYYDSFTTVVCTPSNSGDILGLAHVCELYDKYKKEIIHWECFGKS